MAKKNKNEKAADGTEGQTKKKNPLVIGGLCIALAGVGYMLGGRKAGAQDGAAPTTTIDQLEGCSPGTDAAHVEHRQAIPDYVTVTRRYAFAAGRYAKVDERERRGRCHHCAKASCRPTPADP